MKIIVSMILALTLALGLCGALAAPVTLPAYVYPGDDPILAAVTHYMVDVDQRFQPDDGGVLVPAPIVLKTEMNENETEATVYGNFWIFGYVLDGKVLKCTCGGENPGVMKLAKGEEGAWTVVSMESAEEGDTFVSSIRALAHGDEALFEQYRIASDGDAGYLPQYRRAFLIDYIVSNGLDIEAYQDYGWDPVSLIN